jgi:phosphoglycolate phosphatase-like HAD superfamily hydrolase
LYADSFLQLRSFSVNFAVKPIYMSTFSHIIFDLDGTLTDPRQGIGNSISYALEKMNIEGFDGDVPDSFIGPPLQQSFKELFGLNERNTESGNRILP